MTELVDKLLAYAAGRIDDGQAEEIETLLTQYVDRNLDPDLAIQVEQAIDRDQTFASIVAQARAGKQWFEETLSSEFQPLLDAPASPELQRFVQSLTTDRPSDDGSVTAFPRRTTSRFSDNRWLAVAASIVITLLAGGWGLYRAIESRFDETLVAQARLEQDAEQRGVDRAQQVSRIIALEEKVLRQLSALESSIVARESAQQRLAEANASLETLRSENLDLDTRLAELGAELGRTAEHERENVSLRAALEDAQSSLDGEQALAANQQDTIKALEERLVQSDLVIAAMNTETSSLNKYIAERELTRETQTAAFETNRRKLDQMARRTAELQAELDGAIRRVMRLRADREVLQAALRQSNLEPGSDWTVQVAQYHSLYTQQAPRHLVEVPADESAHIEEWLSEQLGRALAIPDLSDLGMDFKGARLLAIEGRPVAQLMYLDGDGGPLAICLMRNIMGKAKNTELSEHNDLKLVDWRDRAYQYVIVGSTTFETLEALADKLIES